MKRGNFLLLVFAFSILFSISIFSFLPMVSGVDPTDEENPCYRIQNETDCEARNNLASGMAVEACVGKKIVNAFCRWHKAISPDDVDSCELDGFPMYDCEGLEDYKICGPRLNPDGTISYEAVRNYTGECSINSKNGYPECYTKEIQRCGENEYCTETIKNDFQFGVAKCVNIKSMAAPIIEGIEEKEDGGESLNQLLGSKPLIFKTALAVLLIALILVIFIYFKPKKKKIKS